MTKAILFINRTDRTFFIEKLKEYFILNKIEIKIICGSHLQNMPSAHTADYFELIPGSSSVGFKEAILNVVKKHNVFGIFAASNFDLLPLLSIKKELEGLQINLIASPSNVLEICLNKLCMSRFLRSIDINTPQIFLYEDLIGGNNLKFPYVIKPAIGQGSTQTYVVHEMEELTFYSKKISHPLIQEFIEGTHYSIDVFFNENQKAICVVPRIRLRVDGAISVVCKIDMNPVIIEWTERLCGQLGGIGPLNIQMICRDNDFYVHDINPRISSGIIFSIIAGAPLISYLAQMLLYGKVVEEKYDISEEVIMAKYHTAIVL